MRGRETVGDMIRSMAVLMIPVLLLVGWLALTNEKPTATIEKIDWQPVASRAAEEAPFEVVAPEQVPQGWVPNRVVWSSPQNPQEGAPGGNYWMLGLMNPDEIFVQLNQSDLAEGQIVPRLTRDGVGEGSMDINGKQWQQYVSLDDRTRSLVLFGDGVTTIIVGDTGYDELALLAKALVPYQD